MAPKKPSLKRRRVRALIGLAVALVFIIALVGWGVTLDWRALKPSVPARYGRVETAYSGTALALRKEQVVYSPLTGEVDQYVSEGTRVPAGKVVVKVTDEAARSTLISERESLERRLIDLSSRNPFNKTDLVSQELSPEEKAVREELEKVTRELESCQAEVVSPIAGIIAYRIDGLESPGPEVAISNLLNLEKELSTFPQIPARTTPTVRHRQVQLDKPLFKVVDSLQFWVVADLPPGVELTRGQRVQVRFFERPNRRIAAEVRQVVSNPEYTRVVLFFQDYQDFFTEMRWTEVTVITSYHEGVIVPVEALHQEDGVCGVYVKGIGGVVFKPVEVIGQDQESAVVDGLAEGSRVIL
ncbi:MAG: hypothetical protein H0Z38_01670 [Firmicutes bacterium]|nr:hypothetical protein [Bacillota bacterium]